jgi:hypothetical protein
MISTETPRLKVPVQSLGEGTLAITAPIAATLSREFQGHPVGHHSAVGLTGHVDPLRIHRFPGDHVVDDLAQETHIIRSGLCTSGPHPAVISVEIPIAPGQSRGCVCAIGQDQDKLLLIRPGDPGAVDMFAGVAFI